MKDYLVLKAFQGFDPGTLIQITDLDAHLWAEKYGADCFTLAEPAVKPASKTSKQAEA